MPPKNCAACSKMVFPMEELKCLDKTWHKACFKCQVCNMTLNMKNYKGYDKLPYCNAHYPETKFTVVAETPEAKRLAQNSKIQSNIKYHEEFERAKGQYTAVADDPETLRVRKNMQTISNVTYHGDLARKQEMENFRPNEYEPNDSQPMSYQAPPQQRPPQTYQPPPPTGGGSMAPPPQQQPQAYSGGGGRKIGSISDYDPMTGRPHEGSPYTNKTQSTTVYSSSSQPQQQAYRPPYNPPTAAVQSYQPATSQSQHGSSNLMSPQLHQQPNPSYNSYNNQPYQPQQQGHHQPMRAPQQQPPPQRAPPPQQQQSRDPYYGKGNVCKSMYDYSAADDDEVSFREDDLIINCEPIDDGWMMGTVEKTGQHGMLPSNYVERINW